MSELEEKLNDLIAHGSSLNINWGEDTGGFEVDWITSGERFSATNRSLMAALGAVRNNALIHFPRSPYR